MSAARNNSPLIPSTIKLETTLISIKMSPNNQKLKQSIFTGLCMWATQVLSRSSYAAVWTPNPAARSSRSTSSNPCQLSLRRIQISVMFLGVLVVIMEMFSGKMLKFCKIYNTPFLSPSFFLPQHNTQRKRIQSLQYTVAPFYRTPVLVWPRPGTYRERGRRRDGPTGIYGKREEPRLGPGDSFANHVVWGTDFSHLLRFQIR